MKNAIQFNYNPYGIFTQRTWWDSRITPGVVWNYSIYEPAKDYSIWTYY
jgi:hypothetical protein